MTGDDFEAPFNDVTIVGAPFSDGQPFTGSDEGPQLLRDAGLHDLLKNLKWRVRETGDLPLRGYSNSDPKMTREDEEIVGGECRQVRETCDSI